MRHKIIIAAVVLLSFTSVALALNPDTMELTVTPGVTYSVSISSNGGYNFGTVDIGQSTMTTTGITVSNNGNTSSKWQLKCDNTANWTAAAASAADTFNLRALFNAAQPADSGFTATTDDVLSSGYTSASVTVYAGDQSAENVAASGTKTVWFRLAMPTSSATSNQQKVRVYINAVAP